jgi:hypothetical protein
VVKIKMRWPVVTFSLVFPITGAALLTHFGSKDIPPMMFG